MKRSKKIRAKTSGVSVVVDINIKARTGYLVRSEINRMAEEITSSIMSMLSDTTYLCTPISQIEILK